MMLPNLIRLATKKERDNNIKSTEKETIGKILDLAVNNNSISAAGNLNIANGATLLVGNGTVSASIQASSKGSGTVKFNANNTLGGSVGTSTTTLALVEIASGVILSTLFKVYMYMI